MKNNEYGWSQLASCVFKGSFEQIISFLETEKHSLIEFIGAISCIAYCKIENKLEIKNKLKSALSKQYLSGIYSELEKLPPVFADVSIFKQDVIRNLLDSRLSDLLIDQVSARGYFQIPKDVSFYGLTYLFEFLLEIDLNNFEDWISKTERVDFSAIFLDILLSGNPYNQLGISLDGLDLARLGIVQSFYALRRYELNNIASVYSNNENIDSLLETKLPEKSKFLIYLKYIVKKSHGKSLSELNSNEEIQGLLDKLLSIDYDFNKEDLFSQSLVYYSPIYLLIIFKINNKTKQDDLAKYFYEQLFNGFMGGGTFATKVDYSNILGNLVVLLDCCDGLIHTYTKEFKFLSFPYSFCKIKGWDKRIEKMLYYLLIIFIYKSEKKEPVDEYLNMFLSVKGRKQITIERLQEDALEQVLKPIKEYIG